MNQLLKSNKIVNFYTKDLEQNDEQKSTVNPNNSLVIKITNDLHKDLNSQIVNSNYLNYDDQNLNEQTIWISAFMNKFFKNSKWIKIRDVFCDTTFRTGDVLIISGIMKISIGVCLILIGLYTLLLGERITYLVLIIGLLLSIFGFFFLLIRFILFEPRILPFLFPDKKIKRNKQKNSPFYTAASSALRCAVSIPLKYNRNNSIGDFSNIIKNSNILRSPKSAVNALIFTNKLLKKIKSSKIYTRISSSKILGTET